METVYHPFPRQPWGFTPLIHSSTHNDYYY